MKKTWTYGMLLAGVLVAAFAANQLAHQPGKGIFYRVTGGKNPMYLLGSIHVGSKDMYPMQDAITKAVKEADSLVFECDTTGAEARAATAQLMQGRVPLSEAVSNVCYAQVEKAAQKLGYAMSSLEGLKPWAVTSTLTVAAAAQELDASSSSAASALGVENMVRKLAGEKEILYLESAEDQLRLLETFSPELQEYLLESACEAVLDPRKVQGTDKDLEKWPDWWREGDAQAFAKSYLDSLEKETSPDMAREYHHSLVDARNRLMTEKLCSMLESEAPHSYVVTVGLMHLVLPQDSIVCLLREMGYTVEQILN